MSEGMLVLIYTTQSIDRHICCGEPVRQVSAVIRKQVSAFVKSKKSENLHIRISAALLGGCKGRRHIGTFTPDLERSHVCKWKLRYKRICSKLHCFWDPDVS